MSIKRDEKKKLIGQFAVHDSDTGSHQVQIAILTKRINKLTDHLSTHGKDTHSRRGLLMMVHKRRKLMAYLKSHDKEVYDKLISELNLRK